MRITIWRALGLFASTTALFATVLSTANAAPGGTPGPPEGKGEDEVTEVSNSLSVPTIVLGGELSNATCPGTGPKAVSELLVPSGDPASGFPIDSSAYYYVQGDSTWQAQCYTASLTRVNAAWGDNLTGPAKLTTRMMIRVELALYNAALWRPAMDGYTVVKLEPEALDRESAYGTLATQVQGQTYEATPTTFTAAEQRVYDAAAYFSIRYLDENRYIVPSGTPMSAEINASGAVVYGYNLRVSEAGKYAIFVKLPSVKVVGTDAGIYRDHVARLVINVTAK